MLKQLAEVSLFHDRDRRSYGDPAPPSIIATLKENALSNVQEIIPKGLKLFSRLKRVRIEWPAPGDVPFEWSSIAFANAAKTLPRFAS